jgi:hypothetical protein
MNNKFFFIGLFLLSASFWVGALKVSSNINSKRFQSIKTENSNLLKVSQLEMVQN